MLNNPLHRSPLAGRAALFLLVISGTLSWSRASGPIEWRGTSEIKFSGTSTLHSWSGAVTPEPFKAIVTFDEAGNPTALAAKVMVKVAKMNTKNEKRDENMRESMKVSDFPFITGTFDTLFDKMMKPGDNAPAKLPFNLTLLGKDQHVEAAISNWSLKDNAATFDLDFDLSLKACGIEVPPVVYVIRVGDNIKLHATVKLNRA